MPDPLNWWDDEEDQAPLPGAPEPFVGPPTPPGLGNEGFHEWLGNQPNAQGAGEQPFVGPPAPGTPAPGLSDFFAQQAQLPQAPPPTYGQGGEFTPAPDLQNPWHAWTQRNQEIERRRRQDEQQRRAQTADMVRRIEFAQGGVRMTPHEIVLLQRQQDLSNATLSPAEEQQLGRWQGAESAVNQRMATGELATEEGQHLLGMIQGLTQPMLVRRSQLPVMQQRLQFAMMMRQVMDQERAQHEAAVYRSRTAQERVHTVTNPETGETMHLFEASPGHLAPLPWPSLRERTGQPTADQDRRHEFRLEQARIAEERRLREEARHAEDRDRNLEDRDQANFDRIMTGLHSQVREYQHAVDLLPGSGDAKRLEEVRLQGQMLPWMPQTGRLPTEAELWSAANHIFAQRHGRRFNRPDIPVVASGATPQASAGATPQYDPAREEWLANPANWPFPPGGIQQGSQAGAAPGQAPGAPTQGEGGPQTTPQATPWPSAPDQPEVGPPQPMSTAQGWQPPNFDQLLPGTLPGGVSNTTPSMEIADMAADNIVGTIGRMQVSVVDTASRRNPSLQRRLIALLTEARRITRENAALVRSVGGASRLTAQQRARMIQDSSTVRIFLNNVRTEGGL